jgi:dTDP-4-dehydrorhamnose reductase
MSRADELFLIIGHKGMLGSDLFRAIQSRGAKVLGLDVDELDISREEPTIEKIRELRPSRVFNTAALTDVDGCESMVSKAYEINGHGPGHIARACALADCSLTHISTDYVFDGLQRTPYSEETPPNPMSVYGASKLMGEEAVRRFLPENHCIVRTEWLFGVNGKNFVEAILNQALKTDTLRVVDDQTGAPTYTVDLADALIRLTQARATGTVHFTNSGHTTWRGFARAILEITGSGSVRVDPISTEELARPAKRPAYSALDCSMYKRLTSVSPRHWREGLEAYLKEKGRI